MGDISEMILEGILCQQCGGLVDGDVAGYPRKCNDCKEESGVRKRTGKMVKRYDKRVNS